MPVQFTHPGWLLLLPVALAWAIGWARATYVQVGPVRRRVALGLRLLVSTALVLALAGIQWKRPIEGMNVYFLLDRSDSVPSEQQERAREYVNEASARKRVVDRGGVIVFGTDAAIEITPNTKVDVPKIHAVVGTERTDLAGALRLGTAAFPETGQKRLVLVSDGNENVGDALGAVAAAGALGVTIDVLPQGVVRGGDVSIQKVVVPGTVKEGQTFDVKIFAQSDTQRTGALRLFRNDQYLGEQSLELGSGKNLFTLPQTLTEPGFYSYDVQLESAGDAVPQNNRSSTFTSVRGDPRVLVVASEPDQEGPLVRALEDSRLRPKLTDVAGFPGTLAEMDAFDAVFLCNVSAGDLGQEAMRRLESAVRDFGVGLVCVGGDQTYAAGGYRNTPLETVLPVEMELSSKKVLPSGAVVLIMHGMEFNDGNQVARLCAQGVLDALGPQDELGVVLWDGQDRWLFPLSAVGDKKEKGRMIAGMNQGDLPTFQHVMEMAHLGDATHPGLKQSKANLRHMIVFSDGDPAAPTDSLMQAIVGDRITVSTVLISGHAGPDTMIRIADQGRGRFYDVRDPKDLPQIFLKEAMVILKSAIFEEPFLPQVVAPSEILQGISGQELPLLRGYVCTMPKGRAETPVVSDKGDPILAHWQFGLGRAVAFTSDARAKWGSEWVSWGKYRQFWSQVGRWALRRLDLSDLNAEVAVEKGEGVLTVEAVDAEGNYRNFVDLRAVAVSPKGERQSLRLAQTGPGRYEVRFPTRDVGTYLINLMEYQGGQLKSSQAVGASISYSPEFNASAPNLGLLQRIAEAGGGRMLASGVGEVPSANPFDHDRQRTFQPQDLWEWLLRWALLIFVADVAVRRIDLDKAEWLKATATLRRWVFFWRTARRPAEADESLAALLARREQVRSRHTPAPAGGRPDLPQPKETGVARPVAPPAAGAPAAGSVPQPEAPEAPADRTATTDRLLAAKRRATRRLDS
ncbi:MAG TPA: glutamine amidotransferase [Verrucomicrobiota bacterium]|nr:glutamine amidotransferase [Verrucomicrobiota bacterium]HNU50989.1 glutamine amidotransferase [Verrucomicrobiota bacterium]